MRLGASRRGGASGRSGGWQARLPARCGARLFALGLLLVVALTGCRYPTDPEGTLDRITGGELIVGVTENPPWVIRQPDGSAGGVEAELVMALARELDSRVVWTWGAESQLLEALAAHQLDLAIGGFREKAPVKPVVGFSSPYHTAVVGVGAPAGALPPATLARQPVAVGALQANVDALRREGATVVRSERLAAAQGLVAAPDWWLQAHGFSVGPWELGKERYVMAVPPGENGWLLRLQRHLDAQQDIGARLVASERRRLDGLNESPAAATAPAPGPQERNP